MNLDTPRFAALFHADLPATEIPFEVEGRQCWVKIKPLNHSESAEFEQVGVTERPDGSSHVDGAKRVRWLVSRCLTDYSLWRKNGDNWQQFVPPDDTREVRIAFVETQFDLTEEFGRWLFVKCLEVNGLIQTEDAGVAPDPN